MHARSNTALAIAMGAALAAGCTPASNRSPDTGSVQTPPPAQPVTPPDVPASRTGLPPSPASGGDRQLGTWDGYGDLRFGMSEAEARQAWGGVLRKDDASEGGRCFHLWPNTQAAGAELAFMFVDGMFARYSTRDRAMRAPGGGGIGMRTAEIERLYPGQVVRQPHKYSDGEYLRIAHGQDVLIFETDARGDAGKTEEWRVGRAPAVDYVEGCS